MNNKLRGTQLSLDIVVEPLVKTIHDPYWDEILRESVEKPDCDNFEQGNFTNEVVHQQQQLVGEQISLLTAHQHTVTQSPYQSVGEQVAEETTKDTVETLVGEQVTLDTKKSAHQHDKQTHWVERYWVERGGNKYWYYRYTWMEGRKLHRHYIGSTLKPSSQRKKEAVELAIASGDSPLQIKQLLKTFST
ncbi:DUF4102 domain-containing protein [Iningainema tapete]|uniref:DUF4102 domain-containing protein n=1 Tax=Iningainema tapete BLCC-T55 TaxID=2748662 RepID=A0A8J6XCL8_9CYAN|nr:DUF4102 domain-containing protein [Iningainema tapete]MBD2773180.1 DUF4102 domain-containing protein [Iningainema tapete BLCC-T55]